MKDMNFDTDTEIARLVWKSRRIATGKAIRELVEYALSRNKHRGIIGRFLLSHVDATICFSVLEIMDLPETIKDLCVKVIESDLCVGHTEVKEYFQEHDVQFKKLTKKLSGV